MFGLSSEYKQNAINQIHFKINCLFNMRSDHYIGFTFYLGFHRI